MTATIEMNMSTKQVVAIILRAQRLDQSIDVAVIPSSGNAVGMSYKIQILSKHQGEQDNGKS